MWRFYAKDDGCCIEFNTKSLYKIIYDKFGGYVFDEVLYDTNESEKSILKLADNFASKYYEHCKDDKVDILTPLMKLVVLCKHPAYVDEREIRISILNSMPTLNFSYVKPRADVLTRDNGVKYIELPFEAQSANGIVIAPSFNQVQLVIRVKDLVSKLKGYKNVKVFTSKIPESTHK